MLKLEDLEIIFFIVTLIGGFMIASPALVLVLPARGAERFSELYVLGPTHMAEGYPFNVKPFENYSVFLGIVNHMGSSVYYVLCAKIRNQSEPLPNSTAGNPSPLPTLYESRVSLLDGGVWETPLDFSFAEFTFPGNSCSLEGLTINGVTYRINEATSWDSEKRGFFFQIFFELWTYDPESENFSFHNRFVGIWLNMTRQE